MISVSLNAKDTVDWEAKCHSLERKHLALQDKNDDLQRKAEMLTHILSEHTKALPPFDLQFGLQNIPEINFRQTSLADVVETLNQHLQSEETHNIERAIEAREIRIQELKKEIDKLRATDTNSIIREIRLDMPKEMTGHNITFSAFDISLMEALPYATDIAGVTYEIDGNIIRVLPLKYHRPIPEEELNAEKLKEMLDSITHSQNIYFTKTGFKKAIEDNLVKRSKATINDVYDHKLEEQLLTEAGLQRFGYLASSPFADLEQEAIAD